MPGVNIYGCRPPKTDVRDYRIARGSISQLPKEYQLNVDNLKVKNQGSVNSCVAHATASIIEYHEKDTLLEKMSTNYIYGNQRKVFGYDGMGMYLRDACKFVQKYGDLPLKDAPGNYEVPRCWDMAETLLEDENLVNKALHYNFKTYYAVKSDTEIKYAIINDGPVLASIKWYNDYELESGVLVGEKTGESGYHAVMIYGWNETGFLCQNSWGNSWGENGRFILPYSIGVAEAFGIQDAIDEKEETKLETKSTNIFFNFVYKLINLIINFFHKE